MSEPSHLTIDKILVPLDFGEPSLRALAYAQGLAERFRSSLHLLHVVPDPYLPSPYAPMAPDVPIVPRGFLDELVKNARKRIEEVLPGTDREAFRASTAVKIGDARTMILEHAAAESVDLIVMGTLGRKGAAHLFLGSVAERVVRAAPCPVLTVR